MQVTIGRHFLLRRFRFLLAFRFHRPQAGAGWAASTSCWHSTSTTPEVAWIGSVHRLPSWRWMGSFHFLLAFRVHRLPSWRWMGSFHFLLA